MSTAGTQDGGVANQWAADQLIPFGKYLLLNRISVGATAAVYRAKIQGEAGFERLVAIKRILPHMAGDPGFIETFVREAKIAARLNHTNICPIYELGKVGESIYMAMEYVAGKDLSRVNRVLADQGKTMPPVMCAWLASKLCEGLDYAHTLKDARGNPTGIIHRDLSPSNIVVSYEGQLKLIDFGVAKATGRAQQTNVDALKKKLGYMSPEMVRGKPVDQRSDVFGVGITLFEMITGKRLFSGKDDMATLSMVGKAAAQAPSTIISDVPEELEQIVMRALAREPEDRYQSAGDMNDALISYLAQTAPTYGTRQLAQWMETSFAREMEQERRTISELLEASNRPGLIDERRRFFSSPMGAAAAARAQISDKMSRPPPARVSTAPAADQRSAGPPVLPSRRAGSGPAKTLLGVGNAVATAAAAAAAAAADRDLDALLDGPTVSAPLERDRRSTNPPAGRAKPAKPNATSASDDFGDDEATGFYDASGGPVSPNRPSAAPPAPRTPSMAGTAPAAPAVAATDFYSGGGFDEGATEIFFNKDEDIGISELMEEDIAQQSLNPKALAIHRPGQARVAAPAPRRSVPPTVSMPPARRSVPPPAQSAPVVSRPPAAQPARQSLASQSAGTPSPAPARVSTPAADAPRRAHTLRMQAVQPAAKDRNLLVWVGAGLMIAAIALGLVVWARSPGVGAIEVRTVPTHAKVLLDGVHRGEAPLRLDGVRSGTRRMEIRAEGYESVLRDIELQNGATALLDIVLTKVERSNVPTVTTQPIAAPPVAVMPTPAVAPPIAAPPSPTAEAVPPVAAPVAPTVTPAPVPQRQTTTTRRAPARRFVSRSPNAPTQQPAASGGATWGPPPSR
jgi:serine/threonine protein kinase